MILSTGRMYTYYWRRLRGKKHKVSTVKTIYNMRCDNCGEEFVRTAKEINRASSAHCCNQCDAKRFAQSQSASLRKFKKWDASSSKKI